MESETREEIAEAVHHIMDLVSDDPILFDLCERMIDHLTVLAGASKTCPLFTKELRK